MTKKLTCLLGYIVFFCIVSSVAADVVQPSSYQLFGISAGYNNVFFGDYYGRNGDIEGHAAIQGNLDAQSYGFGAGQQVMHQTGPVLVVGGNAKVSSSGVYDGDAYIGGKMTPQGNNNMWNALGVAGTGPVDYNSLDRSYQGTPGTVYVNDDSNFNRPWNVPDYHKSFEEAGISSIPFDFAVAQNELRTTSSELWGLSNTAMGEFDQDGNFRVDLSGQSGLQVLTLDASLFQQLADTNRNLFVTADDDTTLVINVTDVNGLDVLNLQREIFLNGENDQFVGEFDGSNVLINTDIGNVVVKGTNINANILALDAHFDVRSGHISGQVFGASAYTESGGEFHAYYTFDDKHFGPSGTTPEPGTLLIFGAGLGALALVRRTRRISPPEFSA